MLEWPERLINSREQPTRNEEVKSHMTLEIPKSVPYISHENNKLVTDFIVSLAE